MNADDLTILHVEDDPGDRELMRRYLKQCSWREARLLSVGSAEEALEALQEYSIQVMLLDFQIGMPDGLELLKKLLGRIEAGMPSVVMITGHGDEMVAARAIKAGAADYLPKHQLDPGSLEKAISGAVADLESREQAQRYRIQLEILARTDALTGLRNRHALMQDFLHEVARAARYGRPLTLIILDLDHFKHVNDTYGHPTGDEVLVALAQVLNESIRRSDIAGRLGGEEFALLLPETSPDQANIAAEKIRKAVGAGTHRGPDGREFQVTCSLGLAGWSPREPESGAFDAEELRRQLYQAADEALYQAKSNGRNRVEVVDALTADGAP